jgi:dTDP-4-amino-4,6-dideoxygalactose transaminase
MNPDLDRTVDPDSLDAILAVHLYASHVDVDRLRRWAPHAKIVEDCSHCHGATDARGRTLGTLGDISIFSFQATKILTCGEGGAAVTDDASLASRLTALRADSRRARAGEYSEVDLEPAGLVHGSNYALSELHAAILCDQMTRLPAQSAARARGAAMLAEYISDTPLRIIGDGAGLRRGAFYGILVLGCRDVRGAQVEIHDIIREVRATSGARCQEVYPPVPEGPLYLPNTNELYRLAVARPHEFPRARQWYRDALILPHHLFLADSEHIARLADALVGHATGAARSQSRTEIDGATPPSVTVVVLTHGRPELLAQALESVARQDYGGPVKVLVFGDNAPYAPGIAKTCVLEGAVASLSVDGWEPTASQSTFERVALLRNMALELVRTPLVCFLDDDNSWQSNHLSSLLNVMRSAGTPAAHSWRCLVQEDGAEYIPNDFPWLPPGPDSRRIYATYLAHGVFRRDEAIVRDVASLRVGDVDLGMVDLGEWLFERALLDIVRFDPTVSQSDLDARVGEDDKLLRRLRALGVPIACSGKPTLIYRLGGFSNDVSVPVSHDTGE